MSIRTIATIIGMVVGLFTITSTVAAVTWFVVGMRVAPLEANVADFRSETIVRFDRLEAKYDNRFDRLEAKYDTRFDRLETKYDTRFDKYDARLVQIEATARRLGEAFAEMKGTFEAFVGILRESVGFDAPASSALSEGHAQPAALQSPCLPADGRSSAV